MKNLIIYLHKNKSFTDKVWGNEPETLVKIQIDNSLRLGWKPEDIMLVTNFPYEYNGVKSIVIGDENYCSYAPTGSKIFAILDLFKNKLIEKDEIYWFHDLDAFQLEKITEEELELDGYDMGLTDFGSSSINEHRSKWWSTGILFFKYSSLEIFEWIKGKMDCYQCNEETALLALYRIPKYCLEKRLKRMNITYNMATRKRDIHKAYEMADKPLKVIHFHPFDKRPVVMEGKNDNIAVCIYGKSRIGKPLVTKELAKIFKEHGIY